jgi:hypothetical protein
MHLFKITLAFSSLATFTLAIAGTVKWVDNELGLGMITPDNGDHDVPMLFYPKLVCHV